MNILVTGGSGIIGGYVLRELLRAGHIASDYSRTPPLVEKVKFIQGDITNPDNLKSACKGQDAIIHLAAVSGAGRATSEKMIYINVLGTLHVLEAALQTGVRKVVFASSGAATGFSFQKREIIPCYLPIDEGHPCQPQDEYGLSKLLSEITCKRYSDAYGMQTICLRINHNWYVDREGAEIVVKSGWAKGLTVEELWEKRYRKIIEDIDGEWPVPGPPRPQNILWAVTDARDAAYAFRLAVENNEIQHEVFLINGDDTCSMLETQTLIARYYPNVPLKISFVGHASLWSHEKASRMLGYRPQYTWRNSDFQVWLEQRS